MNFFNNTHIDLKPFESNFLNTYYDNMQKSGFVNNLIFFDEKCKCTLNNIEHTGAYNVLINIAQSNVHRFQYKYLSANSHLVNNGFMLVVSGTCNPINLQNLIMQELSFTEVFYFSNQYPNKVIAYISHYF